MQQVLINITLDYETWQPIPQGYKIDWQEDIFKPTELWMNCAKQFGIHLTFFVEIAELFWLRIHQPSIAHLMEQQIYSIITRQHDVQLHVHPSWLPEFGVTHVQGVWHGLDNNQRLHDIPLDLDKLMQRCVDELEAIGKKAKPDFKIQAFRAGKYQIQPSTKIVSALLKAGIVADSSVWKEGYSQEHEFDFRDAFHHHQPYFAQTYNLTQQDTMQHTFLEIPIFSTKEVEWSFDNQNLEHIIEPLLMACNDYGLWVPFSFIVDVVKRRRRAAPLKRLVQGKTYHITKTLKKCIKKPPLPEPLIFTAIGHTKNQKNATLINNAFTILSKIPYLQSVTTSDIVSLFFEQKNTFMLNQSPRLTTP